MVERFQKYLDKKFQVYPKSKALADLKEELLGNLMDRYNEYVAEGVSQEEAYEKAVAFIGDTGDAARLVDSSAGLKVKALRAGLALTVSAVYWMVIVTAYLAVGIFTDLWHPYWLIVVCGGFVYLAAALGFLYTKERSLNKKNNTRILALLSFVGATLVLYFVLSFSGAIGWQYSWLIIIAGIFGWFTYDSFAYSKVKNQTVFKIRAYFMIAMWAVAVFLAIGIIWSLWQYAWLIVLIGVIGILIFQLSLLAAKYNKETKK